MTSFASPIPQKFLEDAEVAEWARSLTLFINDLVAPEGVIATGEATAATTLTQQEKLDLVGVTQYVDLDTVESQAQAAETALAALLNSLPDYNISNDGTVRVLNADDALGAISATYVQAEIENIRDAVLNIGDVLSTVIRDLKNKDIFGV